MSGKDFEIVAGVIRSMSDNEWRDTLIARMIVKFESHYPNFDKTRFMAAIERED